MNRLTREEHITWCKERALEYIDIGDSQQAFASIMSDLNKHPETANHPGIMLGANLLISGNLSNLDKMREFIVGFN